MLLPSEITPNSSGLVLVLVSLQDLSQALPPLQILAAFSIPNISFGPNFYRTCSYTLSLAFDNVIHILLFFSLRPCPVPSVPLFISGKSGSATFLYARFQSSRKGHVMSCDDEVRQQRAGVKDTGSEATLPKSEFPLSQWLAGCSGQGFLKKRKTKILCFRDVYISKIAVIPSISLSCCKV